jgi:hypothetical protein
MPASTRKIPRQLVTERSWPPTTGARIGAAPLTTISAENSRAAASPVAVSRTTARLITMPAAPASPCRKRSGTRTTTDGASAHRTEATTYSAIPTSSGSRRPNRSLSGPAITCPSARPARHAVSVTCTADADVSRSRARSGSPGRYMSIDSGANADSAPRISTSSGDVRFTL